MRTIVITGASDGIGAAAARQLADSGVRLVLVGRSKEKTRAVAEATGAAYFTADFTSLATVRALADKLRASCERIDVLANNAGGIFSGPTRTVDGWEKTFQVNHLAPFLLTHQLHDVLVGSNAAVVNTSSMAARIWGKLDTGTGKGTDLANVDLSHSYTANRAYGNAKLANILFTRQLHERYNGAGISTVAFHPGVVATNFASETDSYFKRLYHGVFARFLTTANQGGATLRHFIEGTCGKDWQSGEFYVAPGKIGRTSKQADDVDLARRFWERSCEMLDISW